MTNSITKTNEKSIATDNVSVELSKAAVGAIGVSSALIGCWAVACLVSGMISSGGPVSLVANFVSAVVG
jgi:hypothetical protein